MLRMKMFRVLSFKARYLAYFEKFMNRGTRYFLLLSYSGITAIASPLKVYPCPE